MFKSVLHASVRKERKKGESVRIRDETVQSFDDKSDSNSYRCKKQLCNFCQKDSFSNPSRIRYDYTKFNADELSLSCVIIYISVMVSGGQEEGCIVRHNEATI